MKTIYNFKTFFLLSISTTFIAIVLKTNHWGYSEPFLIFGILFTLLYIILGIIEVNRSHQIDKSEKFMWIVGFIFFNFITALVYLISGRKRIIH